MLGVRILVKMPSSAAPLRDESLHCGGRAGVYSADAYGWH
jgi:hypothetical protein